MQKTITFAHEKYGREVALISIVWIALIAIFVPMTVSFISTIWTADDVSIATKIAPTVVVLFVLSYCIFVPFYYIICTLQYRRHDRDVIITYDEDTQIVKYNNKSYENEIIFNISDITVVEKHMSKWGPNYYKINLKDGTKIIVTSLLEGISELIKQYDRQRPDPNEGFSTGFWLNLPKE
ncbi:MAG: hypothetical protein J6S87_06865 [Bacteroidales bacterium]|nr:hypothetical protein [Bacteroidales bacterium]